MDLLQVVSNLSQSVTSAASAQHPAPSSNLQSRPKSEPRQTLRTPAEESPFPKTEVKVHADSSTGGQVLIYEFRDSQSGSLMYQIPSEQLLGLMKAIQNQLQRLTGRESGKSL